MSVRSTPRAGSALACLLLLSVICLAGCGSSGQSKPNDPDSDGQSGTSTLEGLAEEGRADFDYTVAEDEPFFRTPRWSNPPEGTFKAGTALRSKGLGNDFVLAESDDGRVGYVYLGRLKRRGSDSDDTPPPKPNSETVALVKGNNCFALDLYARLAEEHDGNLFFSPFSISTALTMTYAGARGDTAKEMRDVLHFDLPDDRLHAAFKSLGGRLKSDAIAGYQFQSANRLFGQKGAAFLDDFLATTRDNYDAGFGGVDFAGTPDEARAAINDWVAKQTQGKIANLVPPDALSRQTQLALVNALYLKAVWWSPFDRTTTEPFHLSSSKEVPVPLMYQAASHGLGYRRSPGLRVLELPFGSHEGIYRSRLRLSMIVLLPDEVDGLAKLESKLTPDAWREWTSDLSHGDAHVYLPRFRTTSQLRLDATLQTLGMKSLFASGEADLSGMNGRRDLFVGVVVHSAYIDVNKDGVEAAAASMVGPLKGEDVPHEPPVFRADHPFLFAIRDERSGSILFLGRVVDPR